MIRNQVEVGFNALPASPVPGSLLPSGVLDQNSPHRLGRGGEEVAASVPMLPAPITDQAKVRLVNQGSRFQRLPRLLLGQALRGQPAQLVVNEGQQLRR